MGFERKAVVFSLIMLMTSVLLVAGFLTEDIVVSGEFSDSTPHPELPTRAEDTNDITMFLHNVSDLEPSKTLPGVGSTWNWFDTVAEFNEVNTTLTATGTNNRFDWYLYPALAGNVSAESITLKIWAKAGVGASQNANIQVEISERHSDGNEIVAGTLNVGSQTFPATGTLWTWTVLLSPSHTFHAGSSIKVTLIANPGTSKIVYFYYDSLAANSRVIIRTPDHIKVAAIEAKDHTGTPKVTFDPLASNKAMEIWTRINDPYGGYDIVSVSLTILDPYGNIVIEDANMTKVSGTPIGLSSDFSYEWDYKGMPSGIYTLEIWALDNSGYNNYNHFKLYTYGEYPVTGTSFFYIGGLPKFVWVNVLDDRDLPLEGALVDAYSGEKPAFSVITSSYGTANLTLYPGFYTIDVHYQNVRVLSMEYEVVENVTAESPLLLECGIYYPVLTIVDSHSESLFKANIYLTHPNGTKLDSVQTDEAGNASFSRLPMGDYDVSVQWRGVDILDTSIKISDSLKHVLHGAVYYLTVNVKDLSDKPLANIGVTAFESASGFIMDFRMSNVSGIAVLRVPAGPIVLTAYWMNTLVSNSEETVVDKDTAVDIVCDVFTAGILLVDARNHFVTGAFVSLFTPEGDSMGSDVSNDDGMASIKVYSGTFNIEVVWMGIEVFEGELTLGNESTHIIECQIFYLAVKALSKDGDPISGVAMTVAGPYGNQSGRTGNKGITEFRLPEGNYHLESRLSKNVKLKKVELTREREVILNQSMLIEIKFDNYPPSFFVTPLFYLVGLPLVIAAILLIILVVLLVSKGRSGEIDPPPEDLEEESEETEPEEGEEVHDMMEPPEEDELK